MRPLSAARKGVLLVLLSLIILSVPSCDSSTDPATAVLLELLGVPAEAPVGEAINVSVRVLDQNDNPFPGATVSLTGQGGVTVSSAELVTGSDGRATATATLPQTPGTGGLTARSGGLTATASIAILSGPPVLVERVAGDGQQGPVRSLLPEPISVRLADAFGNPVPGATVSFEGVGGATPSSGSVTTDVQGVAAVQVTLGPEVGPQGAVARHAQAGEVTFQLDGLARFEGIRVLPMAHTFTEFGQSVTLTAEALDEDGEVVPGIEFEWASSAPGVASVDQAGTVTAVANGEAEVAASADGIQSDPARMVVATGILVTRAEAIAAARAAAVDAIAQGCFVVALAPQVPLGAGTVLREGISEDTRTVGTLEIVIGSPTWLVFLDPLPTHRWTHPVRYILVDAATGAVQIHDAVGPPEINGELRYVGFDEKMLSSDRFEPESLADGGPGAVCSLDASPSPGGGVHGRGPAGFGVVGTLDQLYASLLAQAQGGNIVGVVINGGHPSGPDGQGAFGRSFDRDAQDMTEALEEVGAEVTQFSYRNHQLLDVINGIRQLAQNLDPEDKLVIYFVGHGSREWLHYGSRTANSGRWDLAETDNDFGLPGLLRDLPVGTINVVLDVCHAGSAAQWMMNPHSGTPFNPGLPGGQVHVFAGAAAEKTGAGVRRDVTIDDFKSHPDFDPFRDDPDFEEWFNQHYSEWIASLGGTYTERFLERVRQRELDTDGDGSISIEELEAGWTAEQAALEMLMGQMPPPVASFLSGSVSIVAEDIAFRHTVSQTACPQEVGTITFRNDSPHEATWAVSTSSGLLEFQGPGGSRTPTSLDGTLGPGEEVVVKIWFNCGQAQSFEAEVHAEIEAGETSDAATITVTGDVGSSSTFWDAVPVPAGGTLSVSW